MQQEQALQGSHTQERRKLLMAEVPAASAPKAMGLHPSHGRNRLLGLAA
jgi:hypothetical protein